MERVKGAWQRPRDTRNAELANSISRNPRVCCLSFVHFTITKLSRIDVMYLYFQRIKYDSMLGLYGSMTPGIWAKQQKK
jgi:hypothetical protein